MTTNQSNRGERYEVVYVGQPPRRQQLPAADDSIAYARPLCGDEYLIPLGGEWFMGTREEALTRSKARTNKSNGGIKHEQEKSEV